MGNKKIVIIGGGYAGISTAMHCHKIFKKSDSVEITLIDKCNYHTLMTQLHEVAGGRVTPVGGQVDYQEIFSDKGSIRIIQDRIDEFDFNNKNLISEKASYAYDYLVIGTGSRPEFFGIEGAEENAFKLWGFNEALAIREHIEDCFKLAKRADSYADRKSLLSFVVAGGGFTGVELAGEMAYLCRRLAKRYGLDKSEVNLYLVEAFDTILGNLDEKQIKAANYYLKKIGVKVLTDTSINRVDGNCIGFADGGEISGSLIWSAGIKGNPYVKGAAIKTDNRWRIETNGFLQSLSYENVFCVGDALSYKHGNKFLPQIVENALQSGKLVANNIAAMINHRPLKEYKPKFHGSMISIGPFYGVAQIGNFKLKWLFATALKHLVNLHYHFLIGGVRLSVKYIESQFYEPALYYLFKKDKNFTKKQVTQFF